MRVGLVCPYSMDTPGGVQNHVLGLAGYLSAEGHDVAVLAPGRADPGRLQTYGLRPDQVDSAGRAVPVPYNGSVARVNFGPISLSRVRRWLRDGDFDLVHLHEPVTPSIAGWALVAAEVPVVATFHTATPRSRTMAIAGRLLAPTIGKIDAGIAVSETARAVVVRHLGRDAVVIPNGFQRAHFGPDAGSNRPAVPGIGRWRTEDHPRIAYLGRLDEPRKGLEVLLRALPGIRAAQPDVEVVVAGQGRRRLPAGVVGLGEIDDRGRARLLASVDLFIAPHLARESFGIVLIEAMASGAAVVASDLAPFAELLTPVPVSVDPAGAGVGAEAERRRDDPERRGSLGYLFPAGDVQGLVRATALALADDRSDLTRWAAASTSRFDWATVGPQVLDVYRSTAARAGQGRTDGVRLSRSRPGR